MASATPEEGDKEAETIDEQQRSYYAVIPANVRYDKSLSPNAKLLYGEITALCNEKGYCWASNQYFADLYGVSRQSVSSWIKSLIDGGYINSTLNYKEGTKEILNRYLSLPDGGIQKNLNTSSKKLEDPIQENLNTPIQKNLKENITSLNTTVNTTKEYREKRSRFVPPTLGEVSAYCTERKNGIDPQAFIDYYEARKWYLGKTKMSDWKAAIRTWENRRKADEKPKSFTYDNTCEEGWSL